MNPTEIKRALGEIGGPPNKKLGQHFLTNPGVLSAIVDAADISKGDRVLEVGPGLGVLTAALAKKGASVTAIEKDRRFVEYLSGKYPHVHIVQGDAAKMDWNEVVGSGEWKFVSNLPYAITSLALRKALWATQPPTRVVVLIQKEVADRILARDKKTSLLSLMVALASRSVRTVKRVSPGSFYPAPSVDSAVLEIVPLAWAERESAWGIHPDKIMALAKKGFSHPRKMLASNLGIQKEILEEVGVSGNARAEDLAPPAWAALAIRKAPR